MTLRIRSLSGNKETSRSPVRKIPCEIILLDPSQPNYNAEINSNAKGDSLLDDVCNKLGGILEKDYLGLRFIDKYGQRQWLDMEKPIYKQIKDDKVSGKNANLFSLRFKHYPRHPTDELKQNLTRYLLYLQLRRDLYRGRLVVTSQEQYRLSALVLQAETGDFDLVDIENQVKISDLKILPHTTKKSESRIFSVHKSLKDMEPHEAEDLFLEECSQLETYGVEPINVKDQKGNDLFVGITNDGISTFNGSIKSHTFLWKDIMKISYSHKLFMFQVSMEKRRHILGFKCETSHAACALWKWALDRKYFFTLETGSEAKRSRSGGSLFRRKKTYTFSGRSQKELTQSCQSLSMIPQPQVSRSVSSRVDPSSSVGATGYSTLPRSRGKKSFCSDSSDDLEEIRKPGVPCNTASLGVSGSKSGRGVVMEFMQSLRETPIMKRVSRTESESTSATTKMDTDAAHSMALDCSHKEEADVIVSDMVELVMRQRAGMAEHGRRPSCEPTFTEEMAARAHVAAASLHNGGPKPPPPPPPASSSKWMAIFVFMFATVMVGASVILYLHKELQQGGAPETDQSAFHIGQEDSVFRWIKKFILPN